MKFFASLFALVAGAGLVIAQHGNHPNHPNGSPPNHPGPTTLPNHPQPNHPGPKPNQTQPTKPGHPHPDHPPGKPGHPGHPNTKPGHPGHPQGHPKFSANHHGKHPGKYAPNPVGGKNDNHPKPSGHKAMGKVSKVVVKNYHIKHAYKFKYGYCYRGWRHDHWGYRYWDTRYGCFLYWDCGLRCYYYWCPTYYCYFPVTYCPCNTYIFVYQANPTCPDNCPQPPDCAKQPDNPDQPDDTSGAGDDPPSQ